MSDINKQEIAEISGGQVAQNVEGDQIYIQNQYILYDKVITLKYINNELSNVEEVFVNLLKLNNKYLNFKIKIIHDYILCSDDVGNNYYLNANDISLNIEKELIQNLKTKIWNEKEINSFISKIFNFESLFDNLMYEDNFKKMDYELKFLNIFNKFLLFEKIKLNKMPDIDDYTFISRFIDENRDFDFHEIFGYEFRFHNLKEDGFLNTLKKYGYSIESFNYELNRVKNWNAFILKCFFEIEKYNGVNWNITKLKIYLGEDIPSNLIIEGITRINEIIDYGCNGYFEDEDLHVWEELEEFYFDMLHDYQIERDIEDDIPLIGTIVGSEDIAKKLNTQKEKLEKRNDDIKK